MKSVGIFFYRFSNVFAEKYTKKYSTENEEWMESETATIRSDYVVHNPFISYAHLQSKQVHPKIRTILLFSLTLKDTDFSLATILKRLLRNSSCVPQSISYSLIYI